MIKFAPMQAGLLAVGLAMSVALVGGVGWRAASVLSAPELVFEATGYDPRAPLLGHFAQVRLAVEDLWALPEDEARALLDRGEAWATLEPAGEAEGQWRLAAVSLRRPAAQSGQIAVRVGVPSLGALSSDPADAAAQAAIRIDYGVDRIYLPQGEAEAVQNAAMAAGFAGETPLKLVTAHTADGRLAVKAVILKDRRIDLALL